MTRNEKIQARTLKANKEATTQARAALISLSILIGVIAYNVIVNGITKNLITFNF